MTAQNRRRHDPLKARNASGINLAINRIEQWQLLSDLVALRGLREKSLWRPPRPLHLIGIPVEGLHEDQ